MSPALPKDYGTRGSAGKAFSGNWYFVYLLASKKTSWIYIGCTGDLKNRLEEHSRGKVFSTETKLPVELIYFEAYKSKTSAYIREKNLKTYGSGLAKLKDRLGLAKKGRAG